MNEYSYKLSVTNLTNDILNSCAEIEDVGNLTKQVWYNSIFEKNDSSTDKYTKNSKGIFYDDFNGALESLFSSSEYKDKFSKLDQDNVNIIKSMKLLLDYPKNCQ